LLAALAAGLPATDSTAPPPDQAELLAGLRRLALLLEHSDLAATDAMASLTRQFRPAPGTALQALDDAVARLEFDTALTLCQQLLAAQAPDRVAPS
jgi:hypothetical protein